MTERFSSGGDDIQTLLERFDAAWFRGDVPAIDDFLLPPSTVPHEERKRTDLLVELIMLDLEYRWRHGRDGPSTDSQTASAHGSRPVQSLPAPPRIEDYIDRYPELMADDTPPLKLIAEEYRVRHRWGDQPGHDEYVERFRDGDGELCVGLRVVDEALPIPQTPSGFCVHCPHCQNSIEVAVDDGLDDIHCPSCGSGFSVLRDEASAVSAAHPRRVGHFELLTQLGQGSFGTVWQARDTDLDRMVALKIPRQRQLEPIEVEHFLREARAAAQLRHPNIVSVHEVGRDGDTVYMVSDLACGALLSDWCAEQRPTTTAAAEICRKIAETLQHAHSRGVVHRDLKPQNIVIDVDGEPQLMDFGLARREVGEVTMTIEGQLLGTPAYMSPEQALGEAHQADARSDIYSLGVILFELLTRELPFRGNIRMLIQQVIHEEAPSPRKFNGRVPRDLEIICLKCLEKDAQHRYDTAQEVADELGRFLAGKPINARPISRLARTWRRCKRNPLVSSLLAALSLAFLSGVVGVTSQWIRAEYHAARESTARQETRRHLYVADMNVAQQAWESANVARVRDLLDRYLPQPEDEDLRGFQWYHLWSLCQRGRLAPTFDHDAPVLNAAFSQDGTTLATVGFDPSLKLWDVQSQKPEATLTGHTKHVGVVVYSHDGTFFVSAGLDNDVRLWDVKSRQSLGVLTQDGPVYAVALSPNDMTLAVANVAAESTEQHIQLWDLRSRQKSGTIMAQNRPFYSVAFSPDGRKLASGDQDGLVQLWDLDDLGKSEIVSKHKSWITRVVFSPDGQTLASAGCDNVVKLCDVDTRRERILEGHVNEVWWVTFSPDGRTVASASRDNTVQLWDVETGSCKDTLKGHGGPVKAVAFSPDGGTLASVSMDETVKLWDINILSPPRILQGHSRQVRATAMSPNGSIVASGGKDSRLILWHTDTGKSELVEKAHDDWVSALAFSADGEILASGGYDNLIKLWDPNTGRPIAQLDDHQGRGIRCVAFSPSDGTLAFAGDDGWVRLWDVESPASRKLPAKHQTWVNTLAFSRDGEILASGDQDDRIVLWDVDTGAKRATLVAGQRFVQSLAFSPDRRMLVAGGYDKTIRLWHLGTNGKPESREPDSLIGHGGAVNAVAFSPDGAVLASGSSDHTIKLWYLGTEKEPETMLGHKSDVCSVVFSPDGNTLISGSFDATVRLWHRATEEEVLASSPRRQVK